MMKTITIDSGMESLSRIALGTWAMGGRDWGEADDRQSIATIHEALHLGINLFDTAPAYGPAHAEEVLGRALKGKRDQAFIATKVGVRWTDKAYYQDLTPASIREECEQSLRRLGTDRIDLLQIHWPHRETPLEESLAALEALRQSGKIRHVGVSNFEAPLLEEACNLGRIASLQAPYHLFFRDIEKEILPLCRQKGLSVLVYGPLCKGLLTGKFRDGSIPGDIRRQDPFFAPEVLPKLLAVTARLEEIARKENITPGQLALAFTLQVPGVSCAVVGARSPEQIRENAVAGTLRLGTETMDALRSCLEDAPHVV